MTRESQTLMLQPCCEGQELASLLDQLRRSCPGPVVLDATGLTSITSQCLHILLAADQEYRNQGGSMTLINSDAALAECLALLGLPPNRFATEVSA